MGMKLFVAIFIFTVVGAFAQTSVWERPIDANDSQDNATVQTQEPQEQVIFGYNKLGQKQPIPVSEYFAVDSVPIYDNKIEQSESSHESLSRLGTIFLIGGAIALGGGVIMLTSSDLDIQVYGVVSLVVSPYLITPGIILKAIGSKKGRNADRFRKSREDYILKKQQYLLSVTPTFNLENQSTGARFSLNF
ncbi:MAG: hypothetical protein J6Z31_03825 [Fibrobacter sp.]|nr:hypothetical protein [Fibrobacter sp.]